MTAHPALSAAAGLPEQAQNEMLQLRGQGDVAIWLVGDRAAYWIDALAGQHRVVPDDTGRQVRIRLSKTLIRAWLSDLAGLRPSALRAREAVSRAYPGRVREDFDHLPYSFFRAALSLPEEERCEWLARVRDSADDFGGNDMPLRVFQAQIKAHLNGQPAPPTFDELLGRAVRACERLAEAELAVKQRAAARAAVLEALGEMP